MGNNWTENIPGNGDVSCQTYNYDYVNDTKAYRTFIYGTNTYRKGVRNGFFCIDRELHFLGFLEAENVGWINIFKIQ